MQNSTIRTLGGSTTQPERKFDLVTRLGNSGVPDQELLDNVGLLIHMNAIALRELNGLDRHAIRRNACNNLILYMVVE